MFSRKLVMLHKYSGKVRGEHAEGRFFDVYNKFKLHFYQEIFQRFQNREASLTTVETFCMEAIQALKRPTVNEFAAFMRISTPNAAYKVGNLIRKGYLRKIQSQRDRREYHLEVTQRYMDYYNVSSSYMEKVMGRISERFSQEECSKLEQTPAGRQPGADAGGPTARVRRIICRHPTNTRGLL